MPIGFPFGDGGSGGGIIGGYSGAFGPIPVPGADSAFTWRSVAGMRYNQKWGNTTEAVCTGGNSATVRLLIQPNRRLSVIEMTGYSAAAGTFDVIGTPDAYIACPSLGIVRSTNGLNYTAATGSCVGVACFSLWFDPPTGHVIGARTGVQPIRSTDDGASFADFGAGLVNTYQPLFSYNNVFIYGSSAIGDFFVSTDELASSTALTPTIPTATDFLGSQGTAWLSPNEDYIYLGGLNGRIIRFPCGALTEWEECNVTLTPGNIAPASPTIYGFALANDNAIVCNMGSYYTLRSLDGFNFEPVPFVLGSTLYNRTAANMRSSRGVNVGGVLYLPRVMNFAASTTQGAVYGSIGNG